MKCKNVRIKSLTVNKLIGRFASLSVTDRVIINSYYNGIAYQYIMYKNGDEINIDKISETPTELPQGLEVVASNIEMGMMDYKRALYYLAFFDSLKVEFYGNNVGFKDITSNFMSRKIYISPENTFSFCSLFVEEFTSTKFIKLGNVLYPTSKYNYELAALTSVPVIININIGAVQVTPNREELRYTPKTVEELEARGLAAYRELNKILLEKLQEYLKQNKSTQSLIRMANRYKTSLDIQDGTLLNIPIETVLSKIPDILGLSSIKRILNEIRYEEVRDYKVRLYSGNNITSSRTRIPDALKTPILIVKDTVVRKGVLNYYLDKYYVNSNKYIVILKQNLPDAIAHFKDHLIKNLPNTYDRNSRDFKTSLNFLINNLQYVELGYDDIPEEYKRTSDETQQERIKTSSFNIRLYCCDCESGGTYRLHTHLNAKALIETCNKTKGLIVYSDHIKEDSILRDLACITKYLKVTIITVPKAIIPAIPKCNKFMPLLSFVSSNNTIMSRIAAMWSIKDKTAEYNLLGAHFDIIRALNRLIGESDLARILDNFVTNHWVDYNLLLSLEKNAETSEIENAYRSLMDVFSDDFRLALLYFKYGVSKVKEFRPGSNPLTRPSMRKSINLINQFLKK